MIGHKRVPSREGGVEIVVEELSTRMVQQGRSVTCYNRRGHHVSGKEFDGEDLREYKGVRIRKVFTINRKGLAAMSASVTAAFHAIFGRYDIVHFHAEGPCAMLWLPIYRYDSRARPPEDKMGLVCQKVSYAWRKMRSKICR